MEQLRIGNGYDVHAFCEGRPLYLGGIRIPFHLGLKGHSDADVLIHAIIDALFGASGKGDIGTAFPDASPEYKDISSLKLLARAGEMLKSEGWKIINIDSIVVCQKPKILHHVPEMKQALISVLPGLTENQVNIKGTTTEGLGFTGREEGIASYAVALLGLNGSRNGA